MDAEWIERSEACGAERPCSTSQDKPGTDPVTIASLAAVPCWVAWEENYRSPGDEDTTKIPYVGECHRARSDAKCWLTRAQAEALALRLPKPFGFGGVGIEFFAGNDGRSVGGIDLDECRDPTTGTFTDWALDIIERFASYTEISPSGTGCKIFFLYRTDDLPQLRMAMGTDWGKQYKRGTGKHPPAIELHLGHRYFAVTEQLVSGMPTEFRLIATDTILDLIRRTGPAFVLGAPIETEATSQAECMSDDNAQQDALPADLLMRITGALWTNPLLRRRWEGDWGGVRDTSRSGLAFALAVALHRARFSYEDTVAVLRWHRDTREWARTKGAAANGREFRRLWDHISMARPANAHAFAATGETTEPDEIAALIDEFNQRYMVVNEAGKAMIYEQVDDPVLQRSSFTRMDFADLRKFHLNRRILVPRESKSDPVLRPVADVWLAHPGRRQYVGGVTFDPANRQQRPDVLNLWRGFAVEPRPGSWGLLRGHLQQVICAGNEDHFTYLLGWMARLVQFPAEQGEVAIVLRGGEGTGKGTLARALLRILGQHGLTISHSKHLTGQFNGHLRDTVFLFADEAFFAGDKAHVGALKAIITEPMLAVEAKFQNPVQTPNFIHLMMASNEEWVVPAGLDSRRFLVLEVAPDRANDTVYFGAIQHEMEHGGHAALLHDLLHHDLSGFNHRRAPVTEALQQQRVLSLGTSEGWWLDVLHRGYVYASKLGLEDYFSEWHTEVATEVLFASYTAFAKDRHERHPLARAHFGRFMASIGAATIRLRDAVVGEHVTDVELMQGTTRKSALIRKPRPTGYVLGPLDEARAVFSQRTGLAVSWPIEDSLP